LYSVDGTISRLIADIGQWNTILLMFLYQVKNDKEEAFSSLKVRPFGRPLVRESLAGAAAFPRVTKALMGKLRWYIHLRV
jgi:hypothetical protein